MTERLRASHVGSLRGAFSLLPRLLDGGVGRKVRWQSNAGDHAPVWIALADLS